MTPNQPRIPAGAASSQRPQAARLLEILEASRAFHVQLLASVRARRDAVRTANFAELERLAGARILEFIGETGRAF